MWDFINIASVPQHFPTEILPTFMSSGQTSSLSSRIPAVQILFIRSKHFKPDIVQDELPIFPITILQYLSSQWMLRVLINPYSFYKWKKGAEEGEPEIAIIHPIVEMQFNS